MVRRRQWPHQAQQRNQRIAAATLAQDTDKRRKGNAIAGQERVSSREQGADGAQMAKEAMEGR